VPLGEWLFNRPGDEDQPYNPRPARLAIAANNTAVVATVSGDSAGRASARLWRLPANGPSPTPVPDTETHGELGGLAIGPADDLYVATARITRFTAAGATLVQWDVPGVVDLAAWPLSRVYIAARELGRSRVTVYQVGPTQQFSTGTVQVAADGTFVKGSGPDIFLVRESERWRLPDMDTFFALGGLADLSNVLSLSDEELQAIPRACDLAPPPAPDGAFVKTADDPNIYVMRFGERSWIPSWDRFLALGGQADLSNVIVLVHDDLWNIPEGLTVLVP
jgi:hypothetical protein